MNRWLLLIDLDAILNASFPWRITHLAGCQKYSKGVKVAVVFYTLTHIINQHLAQWSTLNALLYSTRCDSGCVLEAYRRARCHCGWWRTAPAPRSSADCGIQPVNPNLKGVGNSSHFPFTGWQIGTLNFLPTLIKFGYIKLHVWINYCVNYGWS